MTQESVKPIPRATYRLQFHKDFGFAAAAELVPYLARLGISHLYASPFLKARSGSTHGYDIIDYNQLNPELGPETEFAGLVATLKQHGLGQILDFVPNHMGVGGADNVWWLDVLEWGEDSRFAGYFDIDWHPDRRYLEGKLLVPFLGDQYGLVLESGNLELRFDPEVGSFAIWAYGDHKLPICPLHYASILGDEHPELERLGDEFNGLPELRPHVAYRAVELKAELARLAAERADVAEAIDAAVAVYRGTPGRPRSFWKLNSLIQQQNWRAAFWRVAADDINYRRFFNINALAGVRMEHPELFDIAHRLVLDLIADGTLDGLRIDHVDGLLDPKGYFQRLRERAARPFYLVVEKILARHESLRDDWPIEGTTGYEFANLVGGIFVDPVGEAPMTRLYAEFTGQIRPFEDIVRDCKLRIMENEMASELTVLARDTVRIARSHWRTCDFTRNILQAALKEIIARFPVYRTYVDTTTAPPAEADRRDIDWAVTQARRTEGAVEPTAFDFLQQLLTGDLVAEPQSGFSRHAVIRAAMKVQQYSGPVMAKGLEDTAFYRYNRLVSLNEVGGYPERFGGTVAAFHWANQDRARRWPHAMLTSSTHDTKRGEDTRARLNVLSELPEEWERQVRTWSRMLRARRGDIEGTAPPDRNDEYLLYQLLVGAWPAELTGAAAETLDPDVVAAFADRVVGAMIKSVREAKLHSTWAAPNTPYEDAVTAFIRDALDLSRRNPFIESFLQFQERVARAGVVNSLGQTLLKLTVPGMPDLYQGAELWDLSLVDPDNRRPVDFAARLALLEEVIALGATPQAMAGLLERWRDGAVKLAVIHRILSHRREHPELFATGGYDGLTAIGERGDAICAFARTREAEVLVVAVARFEVRRELDPEWGDAAVPVPAATPASRWRDLLTGTEVVAEEREGGPVLPAAALFATLPVAALVPAEP